MQKILIAFLGFFLVVIFQFSFVNIAFPHAWIRPNIFVFLVLLRVLRQGFFQTITFSIVLGLLADIVSGNPVGMTALFLLWCAYGVSFLSRRFLIEHSGSGVFTTSLIAGAFSIGNIVVNAFGVALLSSQSGLFRDWVVSQHILDIFLGFALNVFLMAVILLFQRKFSRHGLVVTPNLISTRT